MWVDLWVTSFIIHVRPTSFLRKQTCTEWYCIAYSTIKEQTTVH
jgi:hypothetical protein